MVAGVAASQAGEPLSEWEEGRFSSLPGLTCRESGGCHQEARERRRVTSPSSPSVLTCKGQSFLPTREAENSDLRTALGIARALGESPVPRAAAAWFPADLTQGSPPPQPPRHLHQAHSG